MNFMVQSDNAKMDKQTKIQPASQLLNSPHSLRQEKEGGGVIFWIMVAFRQID
jgi:hypothetical protein